VIFSPSKDSLTEEHIKNHSCSFLSLALPGLMLLLMTAGTLPADTFDINVNFGGGITGTGSFNTNGTCDPCAAGSTLTNFTFTVDDDTFTEADANAGALDYIRASNTLVSLEFVHGGDNTADFVTFDSYAPGFFKISFSDDEGTATAIGTISAVPEPWSIVLFITALAVTVFTARRKLHLLIRPSR
jgi:hypothetical protein